MAGRTLTLSGEEAQCLTEGGYVLRDIGNRVWRLANEAYSQPFPEPVDRHVSLSAAEVERMAVLLESYAGRMDRSGLVRAEAAEYRAGRDPHA